MIFSLYIINKAGGLVYNKTFSEGLTNLNSNEALILAGTFHGIHAITARIAPASSIKDGSSPGGIELIEANDTLLYCFQTPTGVMFILVVDPDQTNAEILLLKIYELYSDYVLKNPFHTPDMPIRSEMFDINLRNLIRAN
ncbi:hypothetical protein BB558_000227 [Smittium angustum]|uniref:Trafficking protein particle complex subunit n=1 Tax=Smittium angustum TaxID=133377 RepID=A0A2U1JET2_SMIAN|nr:hypothetical protein BB558_000227 [Smittium angustum]